MMWVCAIVDISKFYCQTYRNATPISHEIKMFFTLYITNLFSKYFSFQA